jgi:UDPglucose--hexose-1-phosphate uridylyltransferase
MIELRRDPISSRWVIINDKRDFEYPDHENIKILDKKLCPFCPGKENLTPPALVAFDKKGNRIDSSSKDWNIRVIPNNKPILAIEGSISRRAEGLYDKMNGVGAHEIVIETSSHDRSIDSSEKRLLPQDIIVAKKNKMILKKICGLNIYQFLKITDSMQEKPFLIRIFNWWHCL